MMGMMSVCRKILSGATLLWVFCLLAVPPGAQAASVPLDFREEFSGSGLELPAGSIHPTISEVDSETLSLELHNNLHVLTPGLGEYPYLNLDPLALGIQEIMHADVSWTVNGGGRDNSLDVAAKGCLDFLFRWPYSSPQYSESYDMNRRGLRGGRSVRYSGGLAAFMFRYNGGIGVHDFFFFSEDSLRGGRGLLAAIRGRAGEHNARNAATPPAGGAIVPMPEPASIALLGFGLVGAAVRARRLRKTA